MGVCSLIKVAGGGGGEADTKVLPTAVQQLKLLPRANIQSHCLHLKLYNLVVYRPLLDSSCLRFTKLIMAEF